nr:carbohydrate deacetylase isoform X5 [Columba livia]
MLQVKLIVTGDDFGYCPRRNQGIVDCFLAGAVSNVSLLVNGSAAADAAKLARRYNIPIGLHANLSEGSPVCEVLKTNSSLLNQDGFFHGKMGFRTALSKGLLNMSEVKQELKAQVELFHELTGHLPPHMDGHQHVHVLPEVRHIFAEVLEEYGIKYTRVPIEPGLHNCDWIPPSLMDFYLGVEEDSFNTVDVFTRHGISPANSPQEALNVQLSSSLVLQVKTPVLVSSKTHLILPSQTLAEPSWACTHQTEVARHLHRFEYHGQEHVCQ